eukprot:363418-Chlamydomonas_euryale.AAC.7
MPVDDSQQYSWQKHVVLLIHLSLHPPHGYQSYVTSEHVCARIPKARDIRETLSKICLKHIRGHPSFSCNAMQHTTALHKHVLRSLQHPRTLQHRLKSALPLRRHPILHNH